MKKWKAILLNTAAVVGTGAAFSYLPTEQASMVSALITGFVARVTHKASVTNPDGTPAEKPYIPASPKPIPQP
jgi:hypothetical protein